MINFYGLFLPIMNALIKKKREEYNTLNEKWTVMVFHSPEWYITANKMNSLWDEIRKIEERTVLEYVPSGKKGL